MAVPRTIFLIVTSPAVEMGCLIGKGLSINILTGARPIRLAKWPFPMMISRPEHHGGLKAGWG
jgi:hypothetical protein